MTNVSIPLSAKVLMAFCGVLTTGSPLKLNEVLSSRGTPVASWTRDGRGSFGRSRVALVHIERDVELGAAGA